MGMVDLKAIKPAKGGLFYVEHLPLLADLRDYDLPNLLTMPNAEMSQACIQQQQLQQQQQQHENQNIFSVIPLEVDQLNSGHRMRARSRPNLSRGDENECSQIVSSSLVNALTSPSTQLPIRSPKSVIESNCDGQGDEAMNLRVGDVINLVVSKDANESKSKNDFSSMPAIVEDIDLNSGNIRLIFPQTGQRMNLNYRSMNRNNGQSAVNQSKIQSNKKKSRSITNNKISNANQIQTPSTSDVLMPSTSYDRVKYSTISNDDQNQIVIIQNEHSDILQVRSRPRTTNASSGFNNLANTSTSPEQHELKRTGVGSSKHDKNANEEFVRAAAEGNIKKLNWLIKNRDVDVNGSFAGSTALQVACQAGHTPAINFLLSHPVVSWKPRDPDGNQAIHAAAHGGSHEAVMALFMYKKSTYNLQNQDLPTGGDDDSNVDLNSRNNLRQTPLHLAVGRGNKRVVECLLDHCKVIHNLQDCDGDTPLHDAIASHSDLNLIKKLLSTYQSSDYSITNNNGHNILHHTAIKGDLKTMKLILKTIRAKTPWLIDEARPDGLTALHLSVFLSREHMVDLLLSNSANSSPPTTLTLMTQYDGLPIGIGPISQNSNVLKEINHEEGPARLFQTISRGQKMISSAIRVTPLHVAASCSNSAALVCLLLCKGAKASERDSKNRFPLFFVLDRIIQLTKEKKDQLDEASEQSKTLTKSQKKSKIIVLEASLVPFLVSVSRILIQLAETFTKLSGEEEEAVVVGTDSVGSSIPTALFQRIQSTVKASLEAGVSQIVLMAACLSAALGKECALEIDQGESAKIFKDSKELIEQFTNDNVLRISLQHCFEGALNLTKEKHQIESDARKKIAPEDEEVGTSRDEAKKTSENIHQDLVSLLESTKSQEDDLILPEEVKNLQEDLRECLVCSEKDRRYILQPCGHLIACEDCIGIIKKCVICRMTKEMHREIPACRECTRNQAVIFVYPCNHMMYCRACLLLKYDRIRPQLSEQQKLSYRGKIDVVEVLIETGEIFGQSKCPDCGHEIDDVWTMERAAASNNNTKNVVVDKSQEEVVEPLQKYGTMSRRDGDCQLNGLTKSLSSIQIESSVKMIRPDEGPGVDRELKRLQHELQTIREQTRCPICLDRSRNLVFMCGHSTCQWCGDQVSQCPICRRPVKDPIVLY